ncbi:MAG TPA: PEP-CTERM sorting domain-containing protein, partial [Bryobacteraceae bacterium]|nr:PEP-CTERM sorting domain-containing protein [Bryobacteraceae bacterium]
AAFSPGSPGTGVGQYMINLSATIGSLDTGNIFVTFDEYNGNPFDQDNPGTFVGSDETSAAASVLVTGVPEPSTFLLAGGALLALAGLRRRNAYRQ